MAILAVALGWSPGAARADGDPASDVLSSQTLFLAQDARVPAGQQAQLGAQLSAARRSGYQIRVAIIASPADLGSVTELWRQPQTYARFLGQELSLVYTGPLLVVMPNGDGTYGLGRAAASRPVLSVARFNGLGTAALAAIGRLASASGHPLPVPTAAATAGPAENDTVSWIVFAIGAVLIAGAWILSVRARPLRLPAGDTAT